MTHTRTQTWSLATNIVDRLDIARHPMTGNLAWYDYVTELWYDKDFELIQINLFSAHGRTK